MAFLAADREQPNPVETALHKVQIEVAHVKNSPAKSPKLDAVDAAVARLRSEVTGEPMPAITAESNTGVPEKGTPKPKKKSTKKDADGAFRSAGST